MSTKLLDIQDYVLTAGVMLAIQRPGRFFQLMESTADVDIVFLRNHSEIGTADNMPEGFSFGPVADEFHEVQITSATGQTVKVSISRDEAKLLRLAGTITSILVKPTTGDTSKVTVGAASTAVVASNSTRRRVRLRNTSATETAYYTNDGTAATVNDYPLYPGDEAPPIETTAGINAIRGGGTDIAVRVIEERA